MTRNNFLTTIVGMTIGIRIRTLREALGLSQETVGKACGVTREAVSQWEKGETVPRGKRMQKLADILGTTPTYLLYGISTDHLSEDAFKMFESWSSLPEELQRRFATRINDMAISIRNSFPDVSSLSQTNRFPKVVESRKRTTERRHSRAGVFLGNSTLTKKPQPTPKPSPRNAAAKRKQ